MAAHLDPTLDCPNAPLVADFRKTALGYVDEPPPAPFKTRAEWPAHVAPDEDPNARDAARLCDPDGVGPRLSIPTVPEPKTARNRLHPDIRVPWHADPVQVAAARWPSCAAAPSWSSAVGIAGSANRRIGDSRLVKRPRESEQRCPMTSLSPAKPTVGIRERKKARMRAAIQGAALRLFDERGFDATTIEQIAEAAEVAPSTVFRYFTTKEDLVLSDTYDPLFFESLRTQPADLSPIRALRAALRDTLAAMSAQELAEARRRTVLVLSVPALRGLSFANFVQVMRTVGECVAERSGHAVTDPALRAFTSAAFGIMLDTMVRWADEPDLDLAGTLDEALGLLEAGLPL
ncbi:TetR family transcriptional regulator [Embleya sp. AB8]|uniref:acyl-CoA-like ligand-binding transcription factor n=1 Tax=Embleya sp. AB8 TaxID=3156304 RepID=UPI003C792336